MAVNQVLDSLQLEDLALPYNKIKNDLSEEPRIVQGQNFYVTPGGTLARRPGTISDSAFNLRVDRHWILETLDTPPVVYWVVSAFNSGTSAWELWYQRRSYPSPGAWTQVPEIRQSNHSTTPHEAVVGRGLLFIKGLPSGGSGEKLGSVLIDGTGGTLVIKPWGAVGPTTPAHINAVVTKLTAQATQAATSITVNSTAGLPAAPFLIQVDYEQMTVTSVVGTTLNVTRGVNGTAASAHANGSIVVYRNWSASAHAITVNFGWQYSYCYKDTLGGYTNRVATETNLDNQPSVTGPFFNMIPQVIVQGTADTANYPKIAILRTTDGGGTYYILEEITNTGAGSITYSDTSYTSASGNQDPVPDTELSKRPFTPSLTSNSPPPTVLAPKITGTDTPQRSTPLAYYQGRVWYGIGNVLFYSAQEEINVGVPEESFPSGSNGNFFRFQFPITNVAATANALFVFTLQQTYIITGVDRQSFVPTPLFENYGAPWGHPRAITRFGENVVFLTHDYRIAITRPAQSLYVQTVRVISDPLYTEISDEIAAGAEVELKYWADIDKQYLVVATHNQADPTKSRQHVYDLTRVLGEEATYLSTKSDDFWFTPWTHPCVSLVTGRLDENSSRRRLIFFSFKPSTPAGLFSYLDPTGVTPTDATYDGPATTYDIELYTNLFTIPPGNHVNKLRMPELNPVLYSLVLERRIFVGDVDPNVYYYTDDIWTNPIPTTYVEDPARRQYSIGYKTLEYHINDVCHRVGIRINKLSLAERFELMNLIFIFNADSGI